MSKAAAAGVSAGVGCLAIIIVVVFNVTIGGFLTQYVAETWLTYIKEVPVLIPFGTCMVVGLFLAEPMLIIALVTWILTYAIPGL